MSYLNIEDFKPDDVHVYVKSNGTKDRIMVTYGPALRSLAFVTPPSKTNYPRVTGDGDYTSMGALTYCPPSTCLRMVLILSLL